MEVKQCIVCGSRDAVSVAARGSYQGFRCGQCGLWRADPIPDAATLSALYDGEQGYHRGLQRVLGAAGISRHHTRILDALERLHMRGPLLDIGCANGEFLFWAKRRGFSVHGVEVNAHTAAIANDHGIPVVTGTLAEAAFAEQSFSVVVAADVIEHVADPIAFLRSCHRLLKPGGVLVVATPNMNSFWARGVAILARLGLPSSVFIPPHHLWYFSLPNFCTLLAHEGFSVLDAQTRPVSPRHELGATHLLREFREHPSIKTLVAASWGALAYGCLYSAYLVMRPFLSNDFGMVIFAKKS